MRKYVAFLRGINVGGHTVKKEQFIEIFSKLGFLNIKTVIASGNIIFDADTKDEDALTKEIEHTLEETLGFPVPTMIRSDKEIAQLVSTGPFQKINVTPLTRLYVTFLAQKTASSLTLPFNSTDGSLQILSRTDREIFWMLKLTDPGKTPDGMMVIEKEYGKSATTRNWNTIEKIANLFK